MHATPFSLRTKGQAIVPKPWQGVDPLANGVRVVVDAPDGPGGIDVTIPGGAAVNDVGWFVNASGTRWTYRDGAGTQGGITKVVVRDRSSHVDGLLAWSVTGKSAATATLLDPSAVRSTMVLGAASECASLTWNPPGGVRPRCTGTAAKLACH